jgi:prepilin-type N-terminal cleavage/methylation domain-containing protein
MISQTGIDLPECGAPPLIIEGNGKREMTENGAKRTDSERGFTLIEILTVVGIISLLLGSIIVIAAGAGDRAKKKGTEGMLHTLSMALQRYYNEFREYPPDGYDFPVSAPNGQQLKGSACLTYFLAWMYSDGGDFKSFDMVKPDYSDPDHERMVAVHNQVPFWEGVRPMEDLNQFGEILDRWLNPLRYDNCERTKEGTVLYSPNVQPMAGGSDPDPRETLNERRPFNAGIYDLWSCGANGATEETDATDDIVSGREGG